MRQGDSVCARDYVLERLREADSPMAPADLAGEYGCSNGHARNVLSDLLSDGEVARVGRGEYVAPPPEDADSETDVLAGVPAEIRESGAAVEDSESEEVQADSDAPGNDRHEDGEARSEDRDTTGGDQESDDEMPTEEELERQREQAVDEDDEGNEEADESEEIDVDDGGEGTDESGGSWRGPVGVEAARDADSEGAGGIPLPVSTTTLFAGVALVLVVMYWYSKQSGGSEPEQSEEQEEPQQEEGFVPLVSPNELGF
jgi:hypothetical protein